jgi:hypothetical protein
MNCWNDIGWDIISNQNIKFRKIENKNLGITECDDIIEQEE